MLSGLAVIDAKKRILKFRLLFVRVSVESRPFTGFCKILGDTLAVSDQPTFFSEEFQDESTFVPAAGLLVAGLYLRYAVVRRQTIFLFSRWQSQ
jgi:hypothetical protein